uniref:RNA-directed RNA polymerase L n=1 Tax=Reticulitermes chinensis phenuivirus 1 TaxID=3133476 RepID=A0AAT9JA09_9VIRU
MDLQARPDPRAGLPYDLQTLQDLARSQLPNLAYQGILQTSPHRVRNVSRMLALPGFELEYIPRDSVVRFTALDDIGLDDASSIMTSIYRGMEITAESMRTFAHDFTFFILSEDTDERLDTHYPKMNDASDSLTPDQFYEDDDLVCIFEYGTTRNPDNAVRDYNIKKHKYAEPIIDRLNSVNRNHILLQKTHVYSPIIVTSGTVVTPTHMPMQQELVNELVARFNFSLLVIEEAKKQGLLLGDDFLTQDKLNLSAMLKSIQPQYELAERVVEGGHQMLAAEMKTLSENPEDCARFAQASYQLCLTDALPQVYARKETVNEISEEINKYKSSIIGSRTDLKAIIQLPGVLPKYQVPLSEVHVNYGESNAMTNVWDEVILAERSGDLNLLELTEDALVEMALTSSDDSEKETFNYMKKQYHRVEINISDRDWVDLAKVGVEGKRWGGDADVHSYRQSKKEGFSHDVDTTDVVDWLWSPKQRVYLSNHSDTRSSHLLIRESLESYGDGNTDTFDLVTDFSRTHEHQIMEMYSDIGTELCISLKQNTKQRQMIYKYLKKWGLHLLIKPTKQSEHIFVSFMIPKDAEITEVIPSPVTKSLYNSGSYWYTDFVSFNTSKLVNLVKSEAFSISMLGQWMRFYSLNPNAIPESEDFWFMYRLSSLVHLEDKHQTEEVMTLFRYISMEKFSLARQDSTKMLEKMPIVIRSRLQAWVIQRLLWAINQPSYAYQKKRGSTLDHWANMYNPYTQKLVTDPNQLVELYYLGYAKNKDEVASQNTEFELIKKIVKYEDKLYEAEPNLLGAASLPIPIPNEMVDELETLVNRGLVVVSDTAEPLTETLLNKPKQSIPSRVPVYKFHEYSRHMNCAAADNLLAFWKRLYGNQFESIIEDKIYTRFLKITWEQIATLKATSTFDPTDTPDTDVKVKTTRMKVLIAVLMNNDLIKKRPVDSLADILDWVDKDGGLRVDLFKKNQHGGLREIYVLELHSRVLQLFLEEISRALCETLPLEMMMHPEDKIRRPQEHVIQVSKRKETFKINCSSSNDAKVWNQGQYVPKFIQFLLRLLPDTFHGLIVNGMKQWLYKRMKIPDGVYNLLRASPHVAFYGEEETKISLAFKGIDKRPWMTSQATHLIVRSGMMQGILHYTSSLYHASVLMLRDKLYHHTMKALGIRSMTTDLVSSDDSSRMTDIFSNDEKQAHQAAIISRADHLCMNKFSTFFGIHMSPKSTQCTSSVVEFNSEFYFRASLARPTIKWAYAATSMTEVESLYERQEVFYNLMSELLEGGAGFIQTHITQIAQAMLHYRLLGSSVNALWTLYSAKLRDACDPSLGFFLMDHPRCCGLFGLAFSLWAMRGASKELSCRLEAQMVAGDLTSTTRGTLMNGIQIRFGNRKKVTRLIEQATDIVPTWREDIERDPGVLYKYPENKSSILTRLMVKLTSPNVTTSLSKGNTISRMIASSVYVISHNATTLGSAWVESLDKEVLGLRNKKISLYKIISSPFSADNPLTPAHETILFPLKTQYEHALEICLQVNALHLTPGLRMRRLRANIVVFPHLEETALSLEQVVKNKWFDSHIPASHSLIERTWNYFKGLLPWLRETVHDTLEASPYESHISLRNFIARENVRSRVVHLTGAPVRTSESRDMVVAAVVNNQWPDLQLVSAEVQQDPAYRLRSSSKLQSEIAVWLSYPFTDLYKKQRVESIIRSNDELWDGGILRPPPRLQKLAVIQAGLRLKSGYQGYTTDRITQMIFAMKLGCIGGWAIRQHFSNGKWLGKGKWLGMVGGTKLQLDMFDGQLLSITTTDINQLRKDRYLLRNLIADCDLSISHKFVKHSGWYWNGSSASMEPMGVPIYQSNFHLQLELSGEHLFTTIENESIRLHLSSGRANINICSYAVRQVDYKWTLLDAMPSNLLFSAWRKNAPVESDTMKMALETVMTRALKPGAKLDKSAWITFCKKLMISSMTRQGLNRSVFELFRPDERTDSISDLGEDEYNQLMEDYLYLGLEPSIEVVVNEPTPEEDYAIDTGLTAVEAVDFSFVETEYDSTNIHKTHILMDGLMSNWKSRLGRRGLYYLSQRKMELHNKDIADILHFYLGWDLEMTVRTAEVDKDLEDFDLDFE